MELALLMVDLTPLHGQQIPQMDTNELSHHHLASPRLELPQPRFQEADPS